MSRICTLPVCFLVGHRSSLLDSEALFDVLHVGDLLLAEATPYLGIPFVLCFHALLEFSKQSLDLFHGCVLAYGIAQGYLSLRQCWEFLSLAICERLHQLVAAVVVCIESSFSPCVLDIIYLFAGSRCMSLGCILHDDVVCGLGWCCLLISFLAFPSQSLGRISVLEVVLDEVGHGGGVLDSCLVVLHPFVELLWHFLHLPCELPMAHVLSVHDCGGVCVHLLLAGED